MWNTIEIQGYFIYKDHNAEMIEGNQQSITGQIGDDFTTKKLDEMVKQAPATQLFEYDDVEHPLHKRKDISSQ